MNDDFGKIPDDEAIGAMLEAYRASKDARLVKNCQNGYPDICKVAKRDGVVCADYECDIDSGVRKEAEDARPVAIYQRRKIGSLGWEDVSFDKYDDMICMPSIWQLRIVYATRDAAPSDAPNAWADLWYFVMDESPMEFERIVTTVSPKQWHSEAHKLMRAKYPIAPREKT